jgi:hypothetical protein
MATKQTIDGIHFVRPYSYFIIDDPAAWALALGPAMAVAVVRLRDRKLWLLVGGAIAAAVLADVSGLSEGEVERIWLPFTVWVLVAGAALGPGRAAVRGWLAAQVLTALAIQATIATLW